MSDDIFWQGFDAFKNGYGINHNPYKKDSQEYATWHDGWLAGDIDTNINEEDERPW